MKVALVAVVLVLALIVPSEAQTCRTQPDKCKDNECCTEFGMFGRCRPLKKKGESCELKPIDPSEDHVYMSVCPCEEGLTCKAPDGLVSPFLGFCVQK